MAEDHTFTPSNNRLVDGYLRARIDGQIISDHAMASLFHDADVCSARPHDLIRDHTPARVPCRDAGHGLQWFFFSPASFVGTRRSRTVDGTNEKESWHAEGSPKPVEGSGGGYVQKFSYHVRTGTGTVEKPGWIMAEYTFKDTRAGDVVLCKVYRSPRSKACSSSGTSSAMSAGTKRKAADHGKAATPSTQAASGPRHDVRRGHRTRTASEFQDSTHLAPASVMTLQETETLLMTDEEDDGTTLRVPDGEDPEAFYLRILNLLGDDEQQQDASIQQLQQDADILTARGLLSEYDVIRALATGVTVDELLLHGPSMSCLRLAVTSSHPGGNLGVLCS